MSAVFDITDNEGNILLWYQSDNAWSIMGYFRDIIDGKIPKTENTTLHYYYAEDERKLFGNSFIGDISYEDLTIYNKKLEEFLNKHKSSINNIEENKLREYLSSLTDTLLTKKQILDIKEFCENALLLPEDTGVFSYDTKFTAEFWEFVEDMCDTLTHILECHKQDTYEISFTY